MTRFLHLDLTYCKDVLKLSKLHSSAVALVLGNGTSITDVVKTVGPLK